VLLAVLLNCFQPFSGCWEWHSKYTTAAICKNRRPYNLYCVGADV